jgi:hypothetical protein
MSNSDKFSKDCKFVKRRGFLKDENTFLTEIVPSLSHLKDDSIKWKCISNQFHLLFPSSDRKIKESKSHYYEKLDPTLNRSPISEEENRMIEYLNQYGRKVRQIARLMNRTENAVKNHVNLFLSSKFEKKEIEYRKKIREVTSPKLQCKDLGEELGSNNDSFNFHFKN